MKRIISMILIVATLFVTLTVNVGAARQEEYLSEVALIYEDSVEDALEAIEGTGWKLFDQDLNADADYMIDDGVYLIYKTSTNVEDAITDLRVMDMYGGYSSSDYEKQLESIRAQYLSMVADLRKVAAEFETLYEAGDGMAAIAYRQMNYYRDIKTEGGTETNMYMGEFFLNMPSNDQIVQVLFEGNSLIVSNLITLLAVGISGEDENSLASKVAGLYEIKDTLTDEKYYDDAVEFAAALAAIRAKLLRYDSLSEVYDLEDEEISEEEFVFMARYAALAVLMEEIKIGETNLAKLVRDNEYSLQDLYPVVAAFSEGQMALIRMGQLETVLKYNTPSKPIEEMHVFLSDMEAEMLDEEGVFNPIDVYIGVDRSVFRGSFAMTDAAERQQALTGETWDEDDAKMLSKGVKIALISLASLEAASILSLAGIGIAAVVKKVAISSASLTGYFWDLVKANNAYTVFKGYAIPAAKGLAVAAFAFVLIAGGMYGVSVWYNYYNPDYTPIPNVMVDVKETDLGDKYVKYTAAKVYEDGKLSEKNADLNAYEGREWNALYYTKDANAGNCLTPNFVFSESNSTVARRHQGVSMFGETNAFNLNSHVYSSNAKGAYLTVRYSTAKKAAADLPTVVGSIFSGGGLYVVTALGGAIVGAGGTALLQKAAKTKKKETA